MHFDGPLSKERPIVMHSLVDELIQRHKLPAGFHSVVSRCYWPLSTEVAALAAEKGGTFWLGIQGTQGSGKSTMASFLAELLELRFNLRVANLSIDDFYLTRADRVELAQRVHPLLQTRGVPGTHDIPLAIEVFDILANLGAGEQCILPRFNKALDDRAPQQEWDSLEGPVDVVLFEGWCVGAEACDTASLQTPVNDLEASEDREGLWRGFVNSALKEDYAKLFSLLDKLVVITTDSFDNVFQWRLLQERKLAAKWREQHGEDSPHLLDEQGVRRFIAHYERITKNCLETLPKRCDYLYQIDKQHEFVQVPKFQMEDQ